MIELNLRRPYVEFQSAKFFLSHKSIRNSNFQLLGRSVHICSCARLLSLFNMEVLPNEVDSSGGKRRRLEEINKKSNPSISQTETIDLTSEPTEEKKDDEEIVAMIKLNNREWKNEEITAAIDQYRSSNPNETNFELIVIGAMSILLDPNSNSNLIRKTSSTSSSNRIQSDAMDVVEVETLLEDTEKDLFFEIFSIFPDCEREEINTLLQQYNQNTQLVAQHMLQHGYKKKPIESSKLSSNNNNNNNKISSHDFTSNTWETSHEYRIQAIRELLNNFLFLRKDSIERLFKHCKYHYYHTIKLIEDITKQSARMHFRNDLKNDNNNNNHELATVPTNNNNSNNNNTITKLDEDPNNTDNHHHNISNGNSKYRSKAKAKAAATTSHTILTYPPEVITAIQQSFEDYDLDIKILLRKQIKDLPIPLLSTQLVPILCEEIQFVITQHQLQLTLQDQAYAEELNYQIAEREHALMECGCCYSDYPFEQMIQCTEAHIFCKKCLQHYAEQSLFGDGKTTLKCMNSIGESCPGFFPESMLKVSLPTKVYEKLGEAQIRDSIQQAAIDDLVTCYHCSFQVSMSENAGKILYCPQCQHQTCRECSKVAHIPLKCKEVEDQKTTESRLTVEEAMTKARLRECPKCHIRFFKVEGCNKMTCNCGTRMCYICRQDITKIGYSHFCQTAHCTHKSCGKCILYSDAIADDRQAMKEAGLKALEEQTNTATTTTANNNNNNNNNDQNQVNIDINKYLEAAPAPQSNGPVLRPQPQVHPQYAVNVAIQGMMHMINQNMVRQQGRGGQPVPLPPPPPPVVNQLPPPLVQQQQQQQQQQRNHLLFPAGNNLGAFRTATNNKRKR
jgi:hypothetical protein